MDETLLRKFAKKLHETNKDFYESKFISIYNELKKHFKLSGALKAGSYGKNTKVVGEGDMDLTFTLVSPPYDEMEMRKVLEKKLKQSFPHDDVELLKKSVLIKFSSEYSVDIVYLTPKEFENEKTLIKHIKSLPDDILDIIVLAKYARDKKKFKNIKSYKIELNAIYSSANSFVGRLKDTLSKSGFGDKTSEIYQFLLNEARG